jgi:hypothetical protein
MTKEEFTMVETWAIMRGRIQGVVCTLLIEAAIVGLIVFRLLFP